MKKHILLMFIVGIIGAQSIHGAQKGKQISPSELLPKDILSLVEDYAEAGIFKQIKVLSLRGVMCVTFSADGSSIITGHINGDIRFWNAQTGEFEQRISNDKQPDAIVKIIAGPDGRLLTLTQSFTLFLFDVKGLARKKIASSVESMFFKDDGKQILVITKDGIIATFDGKTGARLAQAPITLPAESIYEASLSPDGSKVATIGFKDAAIALYDVRTGAFLAQLSHESLQKMRWLSVAWSPDGKKIVSAAKGKEVCVWNIPTGGPEYTVKNPSNANRLAEYNHDGTLIMVAGDDGQVSILNAADGAVLQQFMTDITIPIISAFFSPDGNKIVALNSDRMVHIWAMTPALMEGKVIVASQEAYQGIVQQFKKLRSRDDLDLLLPAEDLATLDGHIKYLEHNRAISANNIRYYQQEFNRINVLVEDISDMLGQIMQQVQRPGEKENIIKYIHYLLNQGKSEQVIDSAIEKFKPKKVGK